MDGLTGAQQKAVMHTQGPMLVLAGPGSGKTTVVTRRIVQLVHSGVAPWQILALTFTNKAALQMKERVEKIVNINSQGMNIGTFHSICARLLRKEIQLIGYQNYQIKYLY